MADLIVNASLDQTNSDLKAILDEFNNCEQNAQEDQGIWGQSDVASAMDAFANNWWVHRGEIQSSLSTLSNNVNQACSTWSDADKQLADSLAVNNSQQGSSS
jgi:flagellar biosynthesis chaperone FliJ